MIAQNKLKNGDILGTKSKTSKFMDCAFWPESTKISGGALGRSRTLSLQIRSLKQFFCADHNRYDFFKRHAPIFLNSAKSMSDIGADNLLENSKRIPSKAAEYKSKEDMEIVDQMAIFHVHHGLVSRSSGRKFSAGSSIISGEKLHEDRRNASHKDGLVTYLVLTKL